jgi:acetylcholinesterase
VFGQRSDDLSLIVRVTAGRLRGLNISPDVRGWLGIPYADAPVGRLRFSRPKQLRPWDRDFIRDAFKQPNACPQTPDEFFGNFSGSQQLNPNTRISEDCLFLNVYAPKNRTLDEVS